jgi:thiopeptide-type bacteriocin biosynthesis protein
MASDLPSGQDVEPAEFFVVRVPALPFSTLTEWSAGVESPLAAPGELDQALAHDRALLGARLQALCERADVRSALLVASPDLARAAPDAVAPPSDVLKTVSPRAQIALVRYVSRMASRATPFGLFAACGVGQLGPNTSLSVPARGGWRRSTTLDGGYLESLVAALSNSPELRDCLPLRPNSTITRVAGKLKLVRWRPAANGRRHHQVVEVSPTPELERALAAATPGACVPVIAAAVAAPAPTQTREFDYVRALVKAQILTADLQLQLTGATPLDALISDLADIGDATTTVALLRAVRDALGRLDDGGVSDAVNRSEIAELLAQIRVAPAPEQPCHVVLTVPQNGMSLARTTAGEIERGVQLLARIAPVPPFDELADFKVAFLERYGQREVPLAEALDDQIGIGFGTTQPDRATLLEGLLRNDRPAPPASFARREAALLQMVVRAAKSESREVVLTRDDIEALAAESPLAVPAAFAAAVSLANTSGGPRILFNSFVGPSGLQLLGRFCHADPGVAALVRRHLAAEAALDPGAAFAEIVHLTGSVGPNFLARPLLREYEIEWLGRSGAPLHRRLSISDLLVSVSDDRVVLRSKRLGQRVVPRLTSAHHWIRHSPPMYRFLCSLQAEGHTGGLTWDWGPLESTLFLPRVRWGRLVFCRARWLVAASELGLGAGDPWRAVQAIRANRGLPRWVVVVEDHNELVVDLDNVLSVDSFARLLRNRDGTVVMEMFPGPDELAAQGAGGAYVHELVVPFIAKTNTAPEPTCPGTAGTAGSSHAPSAGSVAGSPLPRIIAPCGEWVVLELNSGGALADRLLLEMVAQLIDTLLADGTTDCWYFTRLNEHSPGIRVHAHGNPELLVPALRGLAVQALDIGMASDASFRTHVREARAAETPDGPTASEWLAQVDSSAALELLRVVGRGDRRQDDRWRVCLVGVDRWLCDAGLDLDQRLAHASLMGRTLARDQRLARSASPRLGQRFRAESLTLGRLLAAPESTDPLAPCIAMLDRRSARTGPIIAELAERADRTWAGQVQQQLASALVGGWVNRVMRSRDRAHEWAIYELLRRFYEASVHVRSTPGHPDRTAGSP